MTIEKLFEKSGKDYLAFDLGDGIEMLNVEQLKKRLDESIPIEPLVSPKYTDTWQLCPKCNGQGIISKSMYIQGDLSQYASTSPVHTCDVCNGMKIIKR